MNKPTLIKDDYRKNGKLDGGSRLVLGTSGLGGVWGKVDEEESVEAILYALEQGIDVIDTSPSYHKAQEYVGKALNRWRGKHPFISTKIGRLPAKRPDVVYLDYSPSGMRDSIHKSLDLLGVDSVDLLFLHEPQLVPVDRMDAIMESLHSFQEEGVVDMLGIGGNPEDGFWPFVDGEKFDAVSTFLKMDACSLEGFTHDIPKYRKEGLMIYAASSLHMGLLGSKFSEYVEHPPETEWIQKIHIENAQMVEEIAKKNGVSLTNLSLRYLFSMEEADRIVLGPQNMDEVRNSIDIWNEGPLQEEIFDEVTEILLNQLPQ